MNIQRKASGELMRLHGVCEACLAGNVHPPRELAEEDKAALDAAVAVTPVVEA